jgi:Flp pilus assembly protein TadD
VRTDYATTLHQTGHDLDALAQVDKVLADRPKFANAVYTKGITLEAIGRRTDAAAAFRQVLTLVPAGDPRATNAKAELERLGG